ncbi:MAG: hypothetical protein KJ709_09100, partial [Nanoarchaeota archaeon]|nr:hypothetical protein [Nanoarchaeota archaeon]
MKKPFIAGLCMVLLVLIPVVFAQEALRDSTASVFDTFFSWYEHDEDGNFARGHTGRAVVDFVIFFVLFTAVTHIGLSRAFAQGAPKNATRGLSIVIGLMLSLSLVTATNVSIAMLFPFAKNLIFFVAAAMIFFIYKQFGMKWIWALLLALLTTYILFHAGSWLVCEQGESCGFGSTFQKAFKPATEEKDFRPSLDRKAAPWPQKEPRVLPPGIPAAPPVPFTELPTTEPEPEDKPWLSRAWGWMTRSSDTPDGPSGAPSGEGQSGPADEKKPPSRRNWLFLVLPLILLLGIGGWRRWKKKDQDIVEDTDDEAGLIKKLKKDNEKKRNRLAELRKRLEERAKLPKHDLRRLLGNARDWLKKRWKSLTDRMRRNADKLMRLISKTGGDLDSLRKRIRVPGRQAEHNNEVGRVNQGLSRLAELVRRLAELLKRESEEPQKDLDNDKDGSLTEGDVRKRQEEADAEKTLIDEIEDALGRFKPEAEHLQDVRDEVEEQVEEKKKNLEALNEWLKRVKAHPSFKAGDLDLHLIPMLKRAIEKAQLDPLQKARLFEKVHSKEYMFG